MSSSENTSALTAAATTRYRQQVEAAAEFFTEQTDRIPKTAVLLGTGEASVPQDVSAAVTIPYTDIPHVPDGAEGTVTIGRWNDAPVVVLDAPLPLHDGYTPREAVFLVRMLAVAGVDTLCLTGVAGGIRAEVTPGDVMLVTNHINFQGVNPLVGPNIEAWGPRFPDMTEPYDDRLQQIVETAAVQSEGVLRKGVYLGVLGPTLGTAAEYRMMRTLGADAVGTGLVPEVITARHMDLRVLALTAITDRCSTDDPEPVSVDDMQSAAESAEPFLHALLARTVSEAATTEATA